ncbi:hypothetical protein ASC77_15755 [Nocardioides sp. Root1257]|uniref:M20/M25/M40 family metallo-hydrolase n=1 Tax=unclassified Nocardioides TaxID=2615069 RepID=UPI0006F6E4DE|nr:MULTISPECIES: M20/M25/M40 family metallo-hydrolase [unclassified Nocardioides]KQW47871.1 hypothetical protein ASC77_15755 [Nocardioides sp. Root1257]KRC45123.1 hypothetical protein ASE24_16705 [Nocardioides sp. Root224]
MSDFTMPLLLDLDVVSLTMSLVNIGSGTGDEAALADSVESALAPLAHLTVERVGDSVVARTLVREGAGERVLVAGHLDTVAGDPDSFAYVEMGKLFGPGACDAKGGLAVLLRAALTAYDRDVTFVLYAGGESDGLSALADARPDVLDVGRAVVLEPTSGEFTTATPLSCSGADLLAARGIAVEVFGPGDPALAHAAGEFVPTAELTECEFVLRTWLQA